MTANLLIKNASVSYANDILFRDLNLTLASSTITCILGPSGIGKSSLLRFIAGLNRENKDYKQSGSLSFNSHSDLHGQIAYMSQSDCLLPWASALENIAIGDRLRGTLPALDRAITIAHQLGISECLNKRPDTLSGGQRQRVAIARTLFEDKPIVLLDEPFSSLDTVTRLELQDCAATFLAEKIVLLVTHDPLEALRMATVIYVMHDKPAKLYDAIEMPTRAPRAPHDPFVVKTQAVLLEQLWNAKKSVPSC